MERTAVDLGGGFPVLSLQHADTDARGKRFISDVLRRMRVDGSTHFPSLSTLGW
jgi:hypothetical protein